MIVHITNPQFMIKAATLLPGDTVKVKANGEVKDWIVEDNYVEKQDGQFVRLLVVRPAAILLPPKVAEFGQMFQAMTGVSMTEALDRHLDGEDPVVMMQGHHHIRRR